ncbi:hypothetical protein J422_00050 [Methanocaldococcus villosus KIN24-T80]|uniref:Uncharacterized protein n=1 Tax=Methanocaldococcus villosus KIN24-T80 TaxID=1069083 RepID=N6W0A1_9EURY|nr:hypothetical protein [Methanocaldococcus villosus]ENN96797.1 hypothetical protein J422_00050 [Methanocaldococcus villosus KIN24-T80]
MILEKSKIEVMERFIFILEILNQHVAGVDEKVIIRHLLEYLEKGNMLDEDILPIANKILEIAKKSGNFEIKREVKLLLFGEKEKLTKAKKEKIRKIIDILELLKGYIENKPYKDFGDRLILNLIKLKILRLDDGVILDYKTEVRSLANLALNIGSYELKSEIENYLLGRKKRKLDEKFLEKKRLLLETLEMVKKYIESKEYKSAIDYEALFIITLKTYRIEENILNNFDSEINSILNIAKKVGDYKLRERINIIKVSQ